MKRQIDPRLYIFFYCLVLSTILWFLNVLNKPYQIQWTLRVRYVNTKLDNRLLVTSSLPEQLDVSVNGYGFALLKEQLGWDKTKLTVDFERIPLRRYYSDSTRYFLTARDLQGHFADQFHSEIQISSLTIDTLFVQVTQLSTRVLPLVSQVSVTAADQHFQNGPAQLWPDSITVTGPANLLDSIRYVRTRHAQVLNQSDTVRMGISLEPIESLSFDTDSAWVVVPIEQFTEMELQLPIAVVNLPDTLSMKLFPANTSVTFLVGLSRYHDVGPEQFTLVVDYLSVAENLPQRAKVQPARQPSHITRVALHPEFVEYILEIVPMVKP